VFHDRQRKLAVAGTPIPTHREPQSKILGVMTSLDKPPK
jgi:hypothetical protein